METFPAIVRHKTRHALIVILVLDMKFPPETLTTINGFALLDALTTPKFYPKNCGVPEQPCEDRVEDQVQGRVEECFRRKKVARWVH